MEKHLYDARVWYDRDHMTLEEKNGKYYIYLSLPAKAIGPARYQRTFRLYFGIRDKKNIKDFFGKKMQD